MGIHKNWCSVEPGASSKCPISGSLCVLSLSAKLSLKNRTTVALAGKTVKHHLEVTIPANSTNSKIMCYRNNHHVWEDLIDPNPSLTAKKISLSPNISMHDSLCSGEYYFMYMDEKLYWVVLVRGE